MNFKVILNIGLIGFLAVSLFSCSSGASSAGASLSGKIENGQNLQMYFDIQNPKTQVLSTTNLDAEGNFSIDLPQGFENAVYRMRIGQKSVSFPLSGNESDIVINGNLQKMDRFEIEISGSESAKEFIEVVSAWRGGKMPPNQLNSKILGLGSPLASMLAAKNMLGGNQSFASIHEQVASRMSSEIPDSPFTGDYKAYLEGLRQAREKALSARETRKKQKPAEKMKPGMKAPNISLPSPDGKNYSLEDLKGKIVLLDFWASWCKPCRRENPHVVEMYDKYKKDGFTVFSVSLDRSPDNWKKAITQDKLGWPYHVSDLKQWSSEPAATYGVRSIPKTFLIDQEGNIAAVALRGAAAIEREVKKLL